MNKGTIEKLKEFDIRKSEDFELSEKYKVFYKFFEQTISGEGMAGENNYLMLWNKDDIEELNNDYEVQEFLTDIILIGSDGGDMAYGINVDGKYIEVPFIGMDDDEVIIIAENFDEFIDYVYNKI
ncbi:SMI1/KNR4 family protein [Clostridium bornimense]|uniref:SMI1/KNR4 family protein n=1 Tax=Clostridium bornimense TaxID=1216932 RepID=UPI001C123EBC|nr:SMI1/KNR4 family protein [Clostridium bornimense]